MVEPGDDRHPALGVQRQLQQSFVNIKRVRGFLSTSSDLDFKRGVSSSPRSSRLSGDKAHTVEVFPITQWRGAKVHTCLHLVKYNTAHHLCICLHTLVCLAATAT